jgi:hypothetical protein
MGIRKLRPNDNFFVNCTQIFVYVEKYNVDCAQIDIYAKNVKSKLGMPNFLFMLKSVSLFSRVPFVKYVK